MKKKWQKMVNNFQNNFLRQQNYTFIQMKGSCSFFKHQLSYYGNNVESSYKCIMIYYKHNSRYFEVRYFKISSNEVLKNQKL